MTPALRAQRGRVRERYERHISRANREHFACLQIRLANLLTTHRRFEWPLGVYCIERLFSERLKEVSAVLQAASAMRHEGKML